MVVFQVDKEIERIEERDEFNDINEAVPSEIDDGNMSQTGEETEGGKSGTEPDFKHRGCKLNVSLSNFIMFINIIILYLQIQSKITLQYINYYQCHCWWFFKILFSDFQKFGHQH